MIYNDLIVPGTVTVWADPDICSESALMRLRLTYAGPLKRNDARQKHRLRKHFHIQLKQFWAVHPLLKNAKRRPLAEMPFAPGKDSSLPLAEWLSGEHRIGNYNYVPLVLKGGQLECSLNVLMLRDDPPGSIVKSGDLDNRVKTVIDALRMHEGEQEIAEYEQPEPHENPFYCLLQDDALITQLTIQTDTLLEPIGKEPRAKSDCRLVITIDITPASLGCLMTGAFVQIGD